MFLITFTRKKRKIHFSFGKICIRQRRRRKYSRPHSPNLKFSQRDVDGVIEVVESEEEELLSLRLEALTSKQEVKELIDPDASKVLKPATPSPLNVAQEKEPSEEDQLRIAALRSAVLKKKEHFKERKKLKHRVKERCADGFEQF